MHKCAGGLIWFVVILFELTILGGALYSLSIASDDKNTLSEFSSSDYDYMAYFLFSVALIFGIVVCCNFS